MAADPKDRNIVQIKNPGAAVLIFNYKYRMGAEPVTEKQAHEVEQIILNTVSLRGVTTSKSKSNPAGNFQITLAPTKNWVNSITPGSWCVILMSQNPIKSSETKYYKPKVEEDSFKMLGRIESVRMASTKDQSTGATMTEYIVTGTDWGDIFNNSLYVDPRIRSAADGKNPIGTAERMIYNKLRTGESGNESYLKTSTENIKTILSFWGRENITGTDISETYAALGKMEKTANQFKLPKEVSQYMGFSDRNDNNSKAIAQLLAVIAGKLTGKDNGKKPPYEIIDDGHSIITPDSILGTNSIWQIIMSNANVWINEVFPEVRFQNGIPKLSLYNRVKPFALVDNQGIQDRNSKEDVVNQTDKDDESLTDLVSQFKNIRSHNIKGEDIILVNVGTNWRDRYNFIEINISAQMSPGSKENKVMSAEMKRKNQMFDKAAIGRDGFKPLIVNAKYIPKTSDKTKLDPFRVQAWKAINKEWYFNIHRMLNGSITVSGQSNYIPVGDNIKISADVIFPGMNANEDHVNSGKGKAYFLAHIESISHSASVSASGARSFTSQIQFVRGIIVDVNGNEISQDRLVDHDTSKVTPKQEVNKHVFGTSSGKDGGQDPDIQKLGHKLGKDN